MAKQTVLPRWRGFNLTDICAMGAQGGFSEEDFMLISDLGFDFVRLPMNYTYWINYNDPFEIAEEKLEVIDEAMRWGEQYGIHVNMAFHRAPGFSVNRNRVEPFDLWRDTEALDAFKLHWTTFAKRYRDISLDKLSFNLVNEPANVSTEAHARVMRATVAAVREIDPDRVILLDGLSLGDVPMPDLGDLAPQHVAQSCRAYLPAGITHYRAIWVDAKRNFPEPQWPGAYENGSLIGMWDRERLEKHYGAWAALAENFNMGVHCGEGGCFNLTPHTVVLRWMEDVLEILKGHNIGYALWNFRGGFGLLDSGRADAEYADYRGHKLDVRMYELMKKY